MKNTRTLIFSLFLSGVGWGYTQSITPKVTNASGGSFFTASHLLSYSIGEVLVTSKASSTTITDGVLQPEKKKIGTGIDEDLFANFHFFPNPTSDFLYLKSSEMIDMALLYSTNGTLLQTFEGNVEKIDLSNYSKGVYFLNLTSNHSLKTIKFVKL